MTHRARRPRRIAQVAGCGGAAIVVLTGCSEAPVRDRTPESVLIEITGETTARVTVQANRVGGLFGQPVPRPRGAPRPPRRAVPRRSGSGAPTTPSRPLTPEEAAAWLAAMARQPDRARTGLRRPAVAAAEVGRLIARDAVVTSVHARPDRVVATLRYAHLDDPVHLAPSSVVRVLRGHGMTEAPVWVGVCTAASRGEWAATPDAFDRVRGCAGWVPARRAVSVGVLRTGSSIATETWMIALLIAASVVLLASAVLRITVRPRARVRWLWIAPTAVLGAAIVAACVLIDTAHTTGAMPGTFGTRVEDATHATASGLASYAVGLAIAALAVAVWTAHHPTVERWGRDLWTEPSGADRGREENATAPD